MFQNLSPILRLLICMLLSVSLHGGLAFYDWMVVPGTSRTTVAPVQVALLPATDMTPSMVAEKVRPLADPQPSHKTSQAVLPEPARQQPKSATRKSIAKPRKALPKIPLPETVPDETATKAQPSEMVCMIPQEVVRDKTATLKAESVAVTLDQPVDAEPSSTSMPAEQSVRSAGGRLNGQQDLVDAVPEYSSNPLPDYPSIARQKHWQGVVWLLVDVSAEGSVEELRIEQSCGHSVLDRAASRTVQRWRFTPARRAGLPTASQVRIPVRFRLEDS